MVRSISNFAQRSPKPWPAFKTQLKPQNLEPQNPKTLFLDPALKRGAPDLHRFCPFHIKLCSTKPKTVASLQNPAQTSKPRTPKPQNLIFGPGTEERSPRFAQILSVPYQTLLALKRGAPDLHRFCPFHIKLCSTKPKTVASLQNPAQTSKPRTPKPQNLIFGPGTEERSPRFAQILSVPYQTLLNEAQNRGRPSKPSSN